MAALSELRTNLIKLAVIKEGTLLAFDLSDEQTISNSKIKLSNEIALCWLFTILKNLLINSILSAARVEVVKLVIFLKRAIDNIKTLS